MTRLQGRCAIVTGGARGIGAAVVRRLVADGALVVIADVLDAEGKELADELGIDAFYTHLDVTHPEDWNRAIEAAEQEFGPVSILVNNAGVVEYGSVETVSLPSYHRVLEINLVGPLLGMKACLPSMRRLGGGVVVNVSSTAGLMGYSNLAAYVSSKWGLRGLTKAAALDLAPDHIRVLSVHPGPIKTPMTEDYPDETTAAQPIARFGRPEEVADMVAFIAAEATFSTGSEFVVDGGAVTGQLLTTPE